MENLSLEEFNPKKAEVIALANKFRSLVIKDINDVDGYKAVHEAQMALVHARVNIVKSSKQAREKAIDYNKAVLKLEKELIAEIEPVEKSLKNQKDTIDKLKERAQRVQILPDRRERLKAVEVELTDDEIIDMTGVEFQDYLNQAKSAQLTRQEAKIKAENDRLDEERRKLDKEKEDERIRQEEAKRQQEKAAEDLRLAKEKADLEKKQEEERVAKEKQDLIDKAEREKAEAKAKADKEKQDLIDEQKRVETARLKKIEDDRIAEEERIAKEKKERKLLEQRAGYNKWLIENGVTKENYTTDFFVKTDGNKRTLFKKISEIEL